jgi:hypothetical protein
LSIGRKLFILCNKAYGGNPGDRIPTQRLIFKNLVHIRSLRQSFKHGSEIIRLHLASTTKPWSSQQCVVKQHTVTTTRITKGVSYLDQLRQLRSRMIEDYSSKFPTFLSVSHFRPIRTLKIITSAPKRTSNLKIKTRPFLITCLYLRSNPPCT